MGLKIIQVTEESSDYKYNIYNILKLAGEQMSEEKGLQHWKNPYPLTSICEDIINNLVYIGVDSEDIVCTFQLIVNQNDSLVKSVEVNKFATHPKFQNKGYGRQSLNYIEELSRNIGATKITLTVYQKSIDSINFYLANQFKKVGEAKTRHFTVDVMEKELGAN